MIRAYRMSPNADTSMSVVIADISTFFGCTRKLSSLPCAINSERKYAHIPKKTRHNKIF